MVVDSSALVAILSGEADAGPLLAALADAHDPLISAFSLVEAGIVLEARAGEAAGRELDLLLHRAGVTTVAVDAEQATLARAAWRRFGKGRHVARLNLGDCFVYALAVQRGRALLFKGDDFAATDVASALEA